MNQRLADGVFRTNQRSITIVGDGGFGVALLPSGVGRFLLAKAVNVTGTARAVALIAHRSDGFKHLCDRILQGMCSKRDSMFILQCAGAELAPGIDVNGVGPAAAPVEAVAVRFDNLFFCGAKIFGLSEGIGLFQALQVLRVDSIRERRAIAV